MIGFKKDPVLTLETIEDVRGALANPVWETRDRFEVKSVWMIGIIDEIVASGKYPYNNDVQRLAEKRLGIPPQPESGSPLSLLVYNAQCYRDSDRKRAAGFVVVTEAMIQSAFDTGSKIECEGGTLLTVRQVNGKLYAFKPRKRVWAANPIGYLGKLVKPELKRRPKRAAGKFFESSKHAGAWMNRNGVVFVPNGDECGDSCYGKSFESVPARDLELRRAVEEEAHAAGYTYRFERGEKVWGKPCKR